MLNILKEVGNLKMICLQIKVVTKTFNKSASSGWKKWPESLQKNEQLLIARFFYTLLEHINSSLNCLVVKL